MKTSEEVAERFWGKVKKTKRCWLWTGASVTRRHSSKERYGQFWNGGKIERAHRYSWAKKTLRRIAEMGGPVEPKCTCYGPQGHGHSPSCKKELWKTLKRA